MIKKEKIMNKKEILNYLELINDELTDAYHLSDTPETVNALSKGCLSTFHHHLQ